MPPVSIRYEQAVYGSFPFWDKGYAILARSPGCRDEWLADLRAACQRYGERPPDAAEAGGLIAVRLPSGPWAVIRPSPQGADDRGRPGALAFHALFLSGADYRKAGAFPFEFARFLRDDWTPDSRLDAGIAPLDDVPPAGPLPAADPRASAIAKALAGGRRVALESVGPIDDLARDVWRALPLRRRSRLSLATWTFANSSRHDLAGLPRLSGVALDRSYVDPGTLEASEKVAPDPDTPHPALPLKGGGIPMIPSPLEGEGRVGGRPHRGPAAWLPAPTPGRLAWLGLAALALSALGLAWVGRDRPVGAPLASNQNPPTRPIHPRPAPIRADRIAEALVLLASKFDMLTAATKFKPDAAMLRLRQRLSYEGPLLTPSELSRLAASPDPDRDRALAWHAQILRFVPDRPLPSDFADGPPEWQLRTLAWSFHLDPGDRPVESIPGYLADELSLPSPVHTTPLAGRYPALADYVRFLRRLPVR